MSSFAAMGRKSKLKRFAEVATFSNVFEPASGDGFLLKNGVEWLGETKGCWHSALFKNQYPIVLELACGKGDYTLALAQTDPLKNFIGIDIKGARIWRGARTALESGLSNVAFIRNRIEFIEHYFAPQEVDEIWITFPDPFEKKPNRRLTSAPFLDRYRKFLKPGGILHLKTDSWLLYEFTLEVIHSDPGCKVLYANPDIYSGSLWTDALEHKTFYEKQHLKEGRTIKYVQFMIS
jgi:tRNA (guanine-N7-)-methyltransferase